MKRFVALIGLVTAFGFNAGSWAGTVSEGHAGLETPARRISQLVERYHDLGMFSGVALVADRGEVVYHEAFGFASIGLGVRNETDTRFRIASITKAMTATLVLSLVDDGLLDLDEPIGTYTRRVRDDIGDRVTTRHLLTHTSGLSRGYLPEPDPGRAYQLNELVDAVDQEATFLAEPGAASTYSNAGYVLLAAVAEAVSGTRFDTLMADRIFEPSGMVESGLEIRPTEPSTRLAEGYDIWLDVHACPEAFNMSSTRGNGGVYATALDVYRFVEALRSGRLIDDRTRAFMFTAGLGNYGAAWQVRREHPQFSEPVAWHRGANPGGFRTQVTLSLDRDRVVVLLANQSISPRMEITQKIFEALDGGTPEPPAEPLFATVVGLLDRDRFEDAVGVLIETRERDADAAAAAVNQLVNFGHHLIRAGDPARAVGVLMACDRVYPDIPGIISSLAFAHAEAGHIDDARREAQRVLAIDPEDRDAKVVLDSLPGS